MDKQVAGFGWDDGMIYQRGFILPGLPNPYLLAAAGIALVVSFSLGYMKGLANGLEQLADYKSEVAAAQAEIRAENNRKAQEREVAHADTVQGYDAALGVLARSGNQRINRLQREASNRATLPLVAESSRIPDATSDQLRVDTGSCEAELVALEGRSVADATQVIWLQEYIKGVCK